MIKNVSAKRLALPVLAVLLAAVVLDLLLWFISPGVAVVNQPGNVFYLDLAEATPVNATFDETGHLVPANGDPQLNFPLSGDQEIKSVAVKLAQPLRRSGYVQVYYGIDEIAEEYSVGFRAKAGTKEFYFNLPGDRYAFLRLDINADCRIDAVSCSNRPAGFFRSPSLSPLRILLIAALLGLAVFIFSRATVRDFIRKLDHNWINPETRRPVVTIVYAVFAMAMLLHHIVVTLWYPDIAKGADIKYLKLLFPLFALVSIPLGHLWKDKGFWFLAALVVLEYLRLAIPSPVVAADFASIVYAFFGCYAVARVLGPKAQKPFLKVFCGIWTAGMFVLCLLGVYSAWTGNAIANLGSEYISVRAVYSYVYRLHMIYFFGISGTLASAGFAVAMVCFACYRKKRLLFLCVPVCAVMILASCLTAARTSYIISAFSVGLVLCILLYDRLNPQRSRDNAALSLGKYAVLFMTLIVVVTGLVIVQSYIPDGFNGLRTKGGLISRALAESAPETHDIVHRDVLTTDLGTMSNGRLSLWGKVLRIVCSRPSYLLFGQSVNQPMTVINADVGPEGTIMGHTHNLWIQTLLESGVPGLILLVAFHLYFLYHAFCLMKNRQLPFWQRILPVPALAMLVGEMLEFTLGPVYCFPHLTLFYLFVGFTVAFSSKIRAAGKS